MKVVCSSCGHTFEDTEDNPSCPHDKTQMGFEGWEGEHGKMRPPKPKDTKHPRTSRI